MNQTKIKQSKLAWFVAVLLCGLLMSAPGVMAVSDGRGVAVVANEILTDNNGQFNLYHESHALLIGNIHY